MIEVDRDERKNEKGEKIIKKKSKII